MGVNKYEVDHWRILDDFSGEGVSKILGSLQTPFYLLIKKTLNLLGLKLPIT